MATKSKHRELKELIGNYVKLQLRDVKLYERIPELQIAGFSPEVEGYIVDVTPNFVYIGEDLEHYNILVELDSVGFITITDPLEDELIDVLKIMDPGETKH